MTPATRAATIPTEDIEGGGRAAHAEGVVGAVPVLRVEVGSSSTEARWVTFCSDGTEVEDRVDGPAELFVDGHGHRKVAWLRRGVPHRVGGPASLGYQPDTGAFWAFWEQGGAVRSMSGPGYVQSAGIIEWYLQDHAAGPVSLICRVAPGAR